MFGSSVVADLKSNPVTVEEQVFVTMMVLHLNALYESQTSKALVPVENVESDMRDFMSLPVPNAVWAEMHQYMNHGFVTFVNGALGTEPASRSRILDQHRKLRLTVASR